METKVNLQSQQMNQFKAPTMKFAFKQVFKNWFFIYFSFVNLFLPFYATIISSLLAPHATLNITAIGLTTSFFGIFNQLLLLLCVSLFFVFNKNIRDNKYKEVDKHTISLIMLIYGCCSTVLFIATSLLYINFSTLYVGYREAFYYAWQFVLLVSPTFIINSFSYILIIYKMNTEKWKSIVLFSVYFVLNLCLIPLLYLTPNWGLKHQTLGIGMGMLISSMLTLIIGIIMYLKTINFSNELKPRFYKESFKLFFKKTSNFVFNFILSTIMKGFLLMMIGLGMKSYDSTTFTSMMMSKIIWYHSLYFCGFFADGLLYSIEFSKLNYYVREKQNNRPSIKIWITFVGLCAGGTLIVCALFNVAATHGLSYLYAQNQVANIGDPNYPEFLTHPKFETIRNFLWATGGVQQIAIKNEVVKTGCYALMYLTIYHVFISSTKLMSLKPIQLDQKFNWKGLLSNFGTLAVVMAFIAIMGCAFNDGSKFAGYLKAFNGLDAFSFSLMLVAIILAIVTFTGFGLGMVKAKKMMAEKQREMIRQ